MDPQLFANALVNCEKHGRSKKNAKKDLRRNKTNHEDTDPKPQTENLLPDPRTKGEGRKTWDREENDRSQPKKQEI
eukprot:5410806-Amphidinium_carterae.1